MKKRGAFRRAFLLVFAATAFAHLEGSAGDEHALLAAAGPLTLEVPKSNPKVMQVVLEEYTFTHKGELPTGLGDALQRLLPKDEVWKEVASRLVVVSDGMMSFFAKSACEVAQHVRVNDETGTAADGGLFNQENVPSETLFYAVLNCFAERSAEKKDKPRTPEEATAAFATKLKDSGNVFQFGGDASTGLGYFTVRLDAPCSDAQTRQS